MPRNNPRISLLTKDFFQIQYYQNNKIENLMLFPSISAHNKFRHYAHDTFICKFCGRVQNEK